MELVSITTATYRCTRQRERVCRRRWRHLCDQSNHSRTIISVRPILNSSTNSYLNVIDHVKIYLMNCRWKSNNKTCVYSPRRWRWWRKKKDKILGSSNDFCSVAHFPSIDCCRRWQNRRVEVGDCLRMCDDYSGDTKKRVALTFDVSQRRTKSESAANITRVDGDAGRDARDTKQSPRCSSQSGNMRIMHSPNDMQCQWAFVLYIIIICFNDAKHNCGQLQMKHLIFILLFIHEIMRRLLFLQ